MSAINLAPDTGQSTDRPAGISNESAILPPLGPPPQPRVLENAQRRLSSGLNVIALRQSGVPLVEIRLRLPFADESPSHAARSWLLSETMLAGTDTYDQVALARALQQLGADLSVSVDADRLLISGVVLRTELASLLKLLKDVLTTANYPDAEVARDQRRLVEKLTIARTQPSVLAREALRGRMFGSHPYGQEMPDTQAVSSITATQLRQLHEGWVSPSHGILVLAGDLAADELLDQVEAAFEGWDGTKDIHAPPPLQPMEAGPIEFVHRNGSVQSSIRLGGMAVPRRDPIYPAFQLANLIFGGYFSSRLVENLRESKGYTYSPHSQVDHAAAGSMLLIDADVASNVTAPALLEINYELGRIATTPVRQQELDDVRQYAIGTLALSIATQAGLASTLAGLAGVGLDLEWLLDHPTRLSKVTVDDVAAAAEQVLAPSKLVAIILGDADVTLNQVASLHSVQRKDP